MSEVVYICDDGIFPYGNAGANRILNIAKVLQLIGRGVKIIGLSGSNEKTSGTLEKVSYVGCAISSTSVRAILDKKLLSGKIIVNELREYALDSNDIIYIYGTNCLFVEALLKYAKGKNIKTIVDVVEWHQPYQYKFGKFTPQYISAERTVTKLAPSSGNVVAISELLKDYYEQQNVNVDVFPPIIDTNHEYNCECSDTVQMIYPGNPILKDDIAVMLKAMTLLKSEELDSVYFHLTGVTQKKIKDCLGQDGLFLEILGDHVIFHDSMDYSELCRLYLDMDYLYFSKLNNKLNQANFPSKVPELMAYGVIPICNKIGDCQHYLDDGVNALLFENDEASEAAEAIRRAISQSMEERSKMKYAARKCAEEHFDNRVWVDKMAAFLNELK